MKIITKINKLEHKDILTYRQALRLCSLKSKFNISQVRRGRKPKKEPLVYRERGLIRWQ
jgi:hypothetical protein